MTASPGLWVWRTFDELNLALVLAYHGTYLVTEPTMRGRSNGLVSLAMSSQLAARSFEMDKERELAQRYPRDGFGWDIILEFCSKSRVIPYSRLIFGGHVHMGQRRTVDGVD